MATNTIQTDRWQNTASPVTTVQTDRWLFSPADRDDISLDTDRWLSSVAGRKIIALQTDGWYFRTALPDTLPVYNPSLVTTVNRVQQNMVLPQYVIGGKGTGSEYALFKKSTGYNFSIWRTPVYVVGTDFDILSIIFTITSDVGVTITPTLYFDNEADYSVGTAIGGDYSSELITLSAKDFNNAVHGKNNFFLEFQFNGSALATINVPIYIDYEVEAV